MRRLAVLAFVLGCGQPTYVATGDVIAVDPAALEVTIRHEDIPGLMGAMTMPFHLRSADVLAGIGPGTRVRLLAVFHSAHEQFRKARNGPREQAT